MVAEIEDRLLENQPAAHERPLAALDLDPVVRKQLVVDDAVADDDARVDGLHGHQLARRR